MSPSPPELASKTVSFLDKYRALLEPQTDTEVLLEPQSETEAPANASGIERAAVCAICLQEAATECGPRAALVCGHEFCFDCVWRWAARSRSCPLCKRPFEFLVSKADTSQEQEVVLLDSASPPASVVEDETEYLAFIDNIACQVCRSSGDEAHMLLCDECDGGFHMHCLRPPVVHIPHGPWLCPRCLA